MFTPRQIMKRARVLLLAGVAVGLLSACAAPISQQHTGSIGTAGAGPNLSDLGARYQSNPRDKGTILAYSTALRAQGLGEQSAAVLETGMSAFPGDRDIGIAYAKALTNAGRLEQALAVIDNAIRPDLPDWNALSVKGAILDQLGRNDEARGLYGQALKLAPGEASVEANLGLSYAMTNELPAAEQHLRRAAAMAGANTQVRQNLALVVGLQGRFEESRALYAAELPPAEVEANVAYIKSLLSQTNRWDRVARN